MEDNQVNFYVYLAYCANGTFYVGYTMNVEERIKTHNAGRGGRYTGANRPLTLAKSWALSSRRYAMQLERKLKRLPHDKKRELADGNF